LSGPADTQWVHTTESAGRQLSEPAVLRPRRHARWSRRSLLGGGTEGNEQLTATTGLILIGLLAALGVTILRIHQLIWVHLFIGLLLLGPVALKLASTGYRFARYYTHNDAYRLKGPPQLLMRLIAPGVVISTVVVFASGIALLLVGPAHRAGWVGVHKASFVVWLLIMAVHVLGHLERLPHSLRAAHSTAWIPESPAGGAGRWIVLSGALVGGLVLAIVLIPQFAPWTAHGAFLHRGH